MIYTVTLNPALDLVIRGDKLNLGTINRMQELGLVAGGKGVNVSVMLAECGVESTALGFCAGSPGDEIKRQLTEKGVKSDFTELESGFSRINIKIEAEEETEINCFGPNISDEKLKEFFGVIDSIPEGSILVLAGNVPPCLPQNIYELIMIRCKGRNIRFVVDAAGERLRSLLRLKPYLIKPNNFELEELFDTKAETMDDLIILGNKCRDMGAENVIISLGAKGSIFLTEREDPIFTPAADGEVINTVGAGDSMLAGFLAGKERGYDNKKCMMLATACGGATSFSVGIAEKDLIDKVFHSLCGNI
ncbi:MAG: 1-phosphofructokinase [Clostridia bacterium]|nr:1-phosphofructokinase [Clostridia bacterium]